MDPRIFISYRRVDGSYIASAIADRISAQYGANALIELDWFENKEYWREAIRFQIGLSDVVLAIIGPHWFGADSADGVRKIDDPEDFVRNELETALELGIPVLPVLVGDAVMPSSVDLPKGLGLLLGLHPVAIRTGRDMAENTDRLIQALDRFLAEGGKKSQILSTAIDSLPIDHQVEPKFDKRESEHPVGTVFISYRREGGAETARLIRYELLSRGWKVFLDVEDLKSGHFEEELLSEVAGADNFLLILSKSALRNCTNDQDWLRKEIVQALHTGRNIVPLLKEHAVFPKSDELPQDIQEIRRFQFVDYSHVYYNAT